MANDDFSEFMKQRQRAADAYVNGDYKPLDAIVARSSPASFFPPRGGVRSGTQEVASGYERDVAAFQSGSENQLEILQSGSSGDIGYWVGLQKANVRMRGSAEPVQFNLRITEIFRCEAGQWKLVHRHADPLASEAPSPGKT